MPYLCQNRVILQTLLYDLMGLLVFSALDIYLTAAEQQLLVQPSSLKQGSATFFQAAMLSQVYLRLQVKSLRCGFAWLDKQKTPI